MCSGSDVMVTILTFNEQMELPLPEPKLPH